jgi:hypothetical protein
MDAFLEVRVLTGVRRGLWPRPDREITVDSFSGA